MVQTEGLWSREGGTLTRVIQNKGNEIFLVGIDARIINCKIIMCGFGPECLCNYGF